MRLVPRLSIPALAALPLLAAAPAPPGPPTLCFPVDIGDAHCLPWGADVFAAPGGVQLELVVEDALDILREADGALVHMETIRRATIHISGIGGGDRIDASPVDHYGLAHSLLAGLRTRIVDSLLRETPDDRERALAWFDYGYLLVAFEQAGMDLGEGNRAALTRACELQPDDGALHLGAALASWSREGTRADRMAYFQRAAELSTDPDGLLRHNLVASAEHFLGVASYDELLAKVRD